MQTDNNVKICSRCKTPKEATLEHFGPSLHSRDGFYPLCRPCVREYGFERRKKIRGGLPPRVPPPLNIPDLTDTQAAYIAGYMDGEGMIGIFKDGHKGAPRKDRKVRTNTSYFLIVKISNSHKPSLQWIADTVGGWITEKTTTKNKRRHYVWCRKSNLAQQLLERVLPYLIVKKEQAEIAIEFQKRQNKEQYERHYRIGRLGPEPRTEDQVAYKEHAYRKLRDLKKPIDYGGVGPRLATRP